MQSSATVSSVHRIATDPDALEIFYGAHFPRVVGFVARRCSSPEDAADVVADVFVEALRSAHRFDPARGEPLAWLLGIAANLTASSGRADGRRRRLESELAGRELLAPADYSWLEERIDAERLGPVLQSALERLSDHERCVFELVEIEGLSTVEAARALGIGPATARMRLTRGRRRFARAAGTANGDLAQPLLREESP